MGRTSVVALASLLVASGCARNPYPVINPSSLTCRVVVPDAAPAIVWVEPVDARSRAAAPRWCATVGPVVFDQGALTARPPSNTLTVITWNVHVGAGDIGELLRLLTRGDFTDGEPVGDYVLLLQEVRRRDERVPPIVRRGLPLPHRIAPSARAPQVPDLPTVARDYGLSLLYVPAMRNGTEPDREDRGNAILSTRPLDDVRILELPFEHQRRIVPIATVAIISSAAAPRRVRVATVHFDTSISLRRGGPFAARRREATALVEALRGSDVPTVAAGDFNTWAGDEGTIALMRRAFPDTPRGRTGSTFRGPLGVRAALDHVFVRAQGGAVSVRRLPDRFGSDHYPVLARLRF